MLGLPREWPEVFDAMVEIFEARTKAAEVAERDARREQLVAKARARFG